MYSSLNIYNQPIAQAVSTVESPNAAYQRMAQFWDLITDLKEGTYKIRSEHRKYLPQESRENDDSYDVRLSRSTVVPYLQRIEKMLSGMLTRKPVRLDDVSDLVREQLFDVDLEGNDLNVWLYETARTAISFGHVGVHHHCWIRDYPISNLLLLVHLPIPQHDQMILLFLPFHITRH